ncbi:hypothetical protein ABW21_db0201140 [Orbilia brochopaga]|nr:hypothetical protein ABW21_db0201140 [Drechslerella brochopaga]
MSTAQHTFGTRRNAPSYPGVGNNDIPLQTQPAVESSNTYVYPPSQPSAASPSPIGVRSPQEPVPAYNPVSANDSPDLIAARRELLDVDARIRTQTDELNLRLNSSDSSGTSIEYLQEEIRKLNIRKTDLQQRVSDLQDPNSYYYQQSQAMTANPADLERGLLIGSRVLPISYPPVVRPANKVRSAVSCAICVFVIGGVLLVIIVLVAVQRSHSH